MKTKSDGSTAINKYKKPVGNRTHIDVYDVCDIFEVDDHSGAIQHALKKLLCNGERGYKPAIQDYREAIGSIQRKVELLERDNFGQQNMLEWPESERRIDAIAQNGNDGEHYSAVPSWDDMEPEYKWMAQDEDGGWWAYEVEPYLTTGAWGCAHDHDYDLIRQDAPNQKNWRNTLQRRPEGA